MRARVALVFVSFILALATDVPDPAISRLSYGAVELRWTAPPSCPDAAWIDARIRADLATMPDARDPLAILIDDEVEATSDGRFALSSRTTSATGSEQRRWVADACTTLAEIAAAQALSAIDQSIVQPLPPLDPNAAIQRDAAPEPEPEAFDPIPPREPTPRPTREPPRRRRVGIGLRPTIGIETIGLPSVGPVAGLFVALTTKHLRADASLMYFMPRYTGGRGGAGAVVQLVSTAVRACPRIDMRKVELATPCAGLEIGSALGRGVGVLEPKSDAVLWAAAQVGSMLGVRVHRRLSVLADAHAAFPLGRPTFALRELGTVWRASIGLRVLVGLEVRLP
jgi:hypothetical protein